MLSRKLTSLILCSAIALAFAGCGSAPAASATSGPVENTADSTADSTADNTADSTTEAPAPDNSKDEFVSEYAAFTVTSPNLNGGKWDDKIGERAEAKGVSPALSWEPVERVKGGSNSINPKFPEFIKALDTDASGNTGNIISVGRVCGTYTA